MNDLPDQVREIRKQRSNKDRWMQAIIAALVAIATTLGGTTYIQLQDQQTDPHAKQDAFTSAMGKQLRDDLQGQIKAKSEFNRARWDEIAHALETQHAVMEALRQSVEQLVSRCAQGQARDDSMQSQITSLREEVRDDRKILYQHIGIQNGHTSKQ